MGGAEASVFLPMLVDAMNERRSGICLANTPFSAGFRITSCPGFSQSAPNKLQATPRCFFRADFSFPPWWLGLRFRHADCFLKLSGYISCLV